MKNSSWVPFAKFPCDFMDVVELNILFVVCRNVPFVMSPLAAFMVVSGS